jgi:hypothetical protein
MILPATLLGLLAVSQAPTSATPPPFDAPQAEPAPQPAPAPDAPAVKPPPKPAPPQPPCRDACPGCGLG